MANKGPRASVASLLLTCLLHLELCSWFPTERRDIPEQWSQALVPGAWILARSRLLNDVDVCCSRMSERGLARRGLVMAISKRSCFEVSGPAASADETGLQRQGTKDLESGSQTRDPWSGWWI